MRWSGDGVCNRNCSAHLGVSSLHWGLHKKLHSGKGGFLWINLYRTLYWTDLEHDGFPHQLSKWIPVVRNTVSIKQSLWLCFHCMHFNWSDGVWVSHLTHTFKEYWSNLKGHKWETFLFVSACYTERGHFNGQKFSRGNKSYFGDWNVSLVKLSICTKGGEKWAPKLQSSWTIPFLCHIFISKLFRFSLKV